MSIRIDALVDQYTSQRSNFSIATRLALSIAPAALNEMSCLGFRSVWIVPTALYRGLTFALLQEGIDSALIVAWEASPLKTFGDKEDTRGKQFIRIIMLTALTASIITTLSRAVSQTPSLNRAAFLLPRLTLHPNLSVSYTYVSSLVFLSRYIQAIPASSAADRQDALRKEEAIKRQEAEAAAQRAAEAAEKANQVAHFERAEEHFLLGNWNELYEECSSRSSSSKEGRHVPPTGEKASFWTFVDLIVTIQTDLKKESPPPLKTLRHFSDLNHFFRLEGKGAQALQASLHKDPDARRLFNTYKSQARGFMLTIQERINTIRSQCFKSFLDNVDKVLNKNEDGQGAGAAKEFLSRFSQGRYRVAFEYLSDEDHALYVAYDDCIEILASENTESWDEAIARLKEVGSERPLLLQALDAMTKPA